MSEEAHTLWNLHHRIFKKIVPSRSIGDGTKRN